MANTYTVGEQTKRKILEESKKLFYANGFTATTYDDICKAIAANRALIPYHYKNKQLLGQAVYMELIDTTYAKLDATLDITQFSSDFISVLHLITYYQLLKITPFTRFLYELQQAQEFSKAIAASEQILLAGLGDKFAKLTKEQWRLLVPVAVGMKRSMTELFYEQPDAVSVEETAKAHLTMLMGYAGYSKKKIDELVDAAIQVVALFDFNITKDFEIVISYK